MSPAPLAVVPEVVEDALTLLERERRETARLREALEAREQELVRVYEALQAIEERASGMQSDCEDGASIEALGFSYIRALAAKARKGR